MREKHGSNFLVGILFGVLVGVVIWYWQKSTAADEGALDLLDRMAAAERQAGRGAAAVSQQAEPAPVDDLQQIRGIGPKFDGRLQQAGIKSITQLLTLSAPKLAELLDIGENRAAAILAEAR